MTYLNKEVQQKLEIYIKKYNQQYTKCLIRGIELPINGRPEELVRQMFIYFLINESRFLLDKVTIKVEANNHDIEIYKKQKNENFKPHQSPLMIVEVKREDANLQNHYNQIERYLTNSSCNIGILYNYHEIISFIKKHNQFQISYLNNLTDIEKLLLQSTSSIDSDLLEFENAQNGNIESFIYLIKKYGEYTNHTIVFKLQNQLSAIDGYLFAIRDNKISYKMCGQYSKKQQFFDYQHFDKLISIIY
ncbi:MAG: type I restriction enzyme HsdR N-terminal domain-containing protein [Nostoc sp. S4]|nr:type I restriction enzyme HsdR N-terminal domain-containing protein [Nostoc sp. S4]